MCCVEVLVKYVLFIVNLLFCLAGLALIGLGIAVLVHLQDVEVLQVAAIYAIPIAVIVLGAVVFFIAFFGCFGAIRESKCLLMMYSIIMLLLAAGKTYLAVVLFQGLRNINEMVENWIGTAFNDNNMRNAFHAMEAVFGCCGTTGPDSYTGILPELPRTCCSVPNADNTCDWLNAYIGCNDRIASYFNTFGTAAGGVIIAIILVEAVAFLFGLFLCISIQSRRPKIRPNL